jgi:enamine deaminase RidA (YjgF/YER057c/UK114 family)
MITTSPATSTRLAPTIQWTRRPGIDTAVINRKGLRELHLTLRPLAGERPSMMLWRLDSALRAHQATVVKHDVFGLRSAAPALLGSIETLFGQACWPVTWVEGASCASGPLAGMEVFAVSGAEVDTLFLEGRPVGRVFNDAWARHCVLGDLRPSERSKPKTDQASQVYRRIEEALKQAGMVLSEVVRTWLFLNDILSWYSPFNTVRTEIFTQKGLFEKGVPASTGIGGKNLADAAMVAGAWAVQPFDGPMRVCEVFSPMQCAARSYGSCFSRAIELLSPGHRRLLISGTASIDSHGRSTRLGDPKSQIILTMSVVETILASRGMGYSDVTRATAYFKHPQDAPLFADWCAEHRTLLPVVVTQAEICRDELLFEIELDAIASRGGSSKPGKRSRRHDACDEAIPA